MDMANDDICLQWEVGIDNLREVEGCVVDVMAQRIPVEVVAAHPWLVEEILQPLKQLPLLEIAILERLVKHGGTHTQDGLQWDGAPLYVSLQIIKSSN